MARFAGLGLEPILADSDDDDGDTGFRRSGFGVRGGDDRRGRGGGNDAVSHSRKTKKKAAVVCTARSDRESQSGHVCASKSQQVQQCRAWCWDDRLSILDRSKEVDSRTQRKAENEGNTEIIREEEEEEEADSRPYLKEYEINTCTRFAVWLVIANLTHY